MMEMSGNDWVLESFARPLSGAEWKYGTRVAGFGALAERKHGASDRETRQGDTLSAATAKTAARHGIRQCLAKCESG